MSRYAMHNPDDPNMEQAIDRADHARKEARENALIEPPTVDDAWRKLSAALDAAGLDPDTRCAIAVAAIEYASAKALAALDRVMNSMPAGAP